MTDGIIPYVNCNDLKFSTALFAAMYLACLMPAYSQSLGKKRNLSLAPSAERFCRGKQRDLFSVAHIEKTELVSDLLAFIQSFQSPNQKHLVNPVHTMGTLITIAGLWMLVMLHFLVSVIFDMSRAMRITYFLQSSFAKRFSLSNATQLLGSRDETRTWVSLVLVHSTHSHAQLYL